MKTKLVKFNDDGTQCKRDIEYLRRHPECGITFIQDKPFKPNNPKHKFRPHDRNFSIDILDRRIPLDPDIPPRPPIGQPPKMGEAVGAPPYTNEYLPQDFTNFQQQGRRLIPDHLQFERSGGYARLPTANAETDLPFPVPRIGNNNYSHQTPERPTRPVGDIELEDFGAGVGIQNEAPPPIRQTRLRPLADPRDTEFNIIDLPEEIKDYFISTKGRVPNEIDVNVLKNDLIELQNLIEVSEGRQQTERDELIRNVDEGNEELADANMRALGRHAANKSDLRNLKNKLRETLNKIRQRRVLSPTRRQTRIRPLPDPRDTEFNITDLPKEIKEEILKINYVDKELLSLQGKQIGDYGILDLENDVKIQEIIQELEADINISLTMREIGGEEFNEEELNELQRLKTKLENHLVNRRKLQTSRKILDSQPDKLKPRGMTDEELIDLQIEQLTRNLPQKEAKQVERSIRKGKEKVKPTEQEMFPIEPVSEELQILKQIEEILPPNETELTIRQKENLVKEMASRGVSRQRVEEVLNKYDAYDPALEQAVGRRPRTEEERLLRRLRSSIREIPTRDTNLLPERQPSIELREDTPLTRGRTDIAPGRTRIQKVMDKTAGKLPEELRSVYKTAQRKAEAFNENVKTRSLEAIQRFQTTSDRIFGQKYASIVGEIRGETIGLQEMGVEMGTIAAAADGNINVQPPSTEDITGLRPSDIQEALDFDPLGADYISPFVGATRPKLTYKERLRRIRAGAFSREAGIGGAGAVGGVLIGFGVAKWMQDAGVDNKFAIAAAAGGAGGLGSRILTMAGTRALTRAGTRAVATTATTATIRAGTSFIRAGLAGGEGAIIGLALMPVDMALNNFLLAHNFSHIGANLTSGAVVGGTATALTTMGLAALGAAPETLGVSLVVGAAAMAATSIVGIFTGADADREERKAKEKAERARNELISTGNARKRLLATLPNYGYNFDRALNAFADKNSLGIDNDTWNTFTSNSRSMFIERPSNSHHPTPTTGEPPTGEQKRLNDLFSKYITHKLISRVCTGAGGCEELRRQDLGMLSKDEFDFLNDKTGSTWQSQADMQVEMSVQELNYTHKRMGQAQAKMINAWNNELKVANQLDPYVVQTAQLDPTFREKYNLNLKLDAQQRVVDAYQDNQTKFEQLPKNIRDMANLDPDFNDTIHHYYNSMETTAGQLQVSVSQLIELQNLDGKEQRDKYQEFQFDNIKQDPNVVSEAEKISREEDAIRNGAVQFYDIDQAYLLSDPTAITSWNPSDSQILQAYNAGMTLREYVDYMHELAKGENGDFSRLPIYTQEQIKQFTDDDIAHFKDELKMTGHEGLYTWDEQNRSWILHKSNNNVLSSQDYQSPFIPEKLLRARKEYADMIHGLNAKTQNEVDNYNNKLMKELSVYGRHYDEMVAGYNDELLYQGRDDLLYYNIGNIYDINKLEFNPISQKLGDTVPENVVSKTDVVSKADVVSQNEATKRQLNPNVRAKNDKEKEIANSYGLSVRDYQDVKRDIQSKNIKNPTQRQIEQAVAEVKASPASAPPMAS